WRADGAGWQARGDRARSARPAIDPQAAPARPVAREPHAPGAQPMIAPGRRPSILLLGNVLTPGGTEGQFVEIACGLDRSRWDLHVGCVRAEGPLRTKLEAAGLRVRSEERRVEKECRSRWSPDH